MRSRLTARSWNTTLIHDHTADLGPKVEEVDRKVHELSDSLEVKLRALTMLVFTRGSDQENDAVRRLKDTVRSAATVLSAASTTNGTVGVYEDNIRSNASVSPWEPDEHFYQWMTTAIDFSTVLPAENEENREYSPHHLNDDATSVVSLIQAQDSSLQSNSGLPGTMVACNGHTRVSATTTIPTLNIQHEDNGVPGDSVSVEQERPSPPHNQDQDFSRAVTALPGHSKKDHLGAKSSSHTRSSSAPGSMFSTASLVPFRAEKPRFWKRSRARSQANIAESRSGLKVHEPKSRAAHPASSIASEDHDVFRFAELYSQARSSMQTANVPAPIRRGGKIYFKAVYVGDGACGKTCSLMYVELLI